MSKGWWYRASQQQKLAQVVAAIDLGLTAKAVAMISGVDMTKIGPESTVLQFAGYHGLSFREAQENRRNDREPLPRKANYRRKIGDMRRAYWQGGRDLSDDGIAAFNTKEVDEAA